MPRAHPGLLEARRPRAGEVRPKSHLILGLRRYLEIRGGGGFPPPPSSQTLHPLGRTEHHPELKLCMVLKEKRFVQKKGPRPPFGMDLARNIRFYKGLGPFRGHFEVPPASRRAARGAFFMEILEILEIIFVKLIF